MSSTASTTASTSNIYKEINMLEFTDDNPDKKGETEKVFTHLQNKDLLIPSNLIITEQELFRTIISRLSFIKIETKSTVKAASRRVPNNLVEPWNTFLSEAFNASLSIDAVICKFYNYKLDHLTINSEETTVDLFMEVVDIIHIGGSDPRMLRSINADGINLLATVEVKSNQLMSDIIQGIIDENNLSDDGDESELYSIYNLTREVKDYHTKNYTKYNNLKRIVHQGFGYIVINDCRYGIITTLNQIWFMCRKPENPSILLIFPAVLINQLHTSNQASFWKCLRYFENLSLLNPIAHSNPPNDSDDEGLDNQDDPPLPPLLNKKNQKNKNRDYNSSCNTRFLPYITGGGLGISSRTRSKSNTIGNNTELKETKEDLLLKHMKNYDHNWFNFRNMLGSGRTGSIFKTTLGRKTGALKMVALYKDKKKLKELLNEIKIYIGPLKEI
ncbi:unnamed protein product [Rhizophagus irregularis]|nr:unnamed protein product [Rhizophagus irregularis]